MIQNILYRGIINVDIVQTVQPTFKSVKACVSYCKVCERKKNKKKRKQHQTNVMDLTDIWNKMCATPRDFHCKNSDRSFFEAYFILTDT